MNCFLTESFLLSTPTAQKLYTEHAAKMPIIDYHCHVSPREIWEDKRFQTITDVWLSGDHYKWRLMRAGGVDEFYITGNASPYEKFLKFASVLPYAIGNPMYHWCHLELKNYFGYDGVLNSDTAPEVWNLCNEKLKDPDMSVRGIIRKSNVRFIGTTDDPIDSLEYHRLLSEDSTMKTVVAPSFRPDKALNIEKADWCDYIARLSSVAGVVITDIDSMKQALHARIEYFHSLNCKASDHGLDAMVYAEADSDSLNKIMQKRLAGQTVTPQEAAAFKTELLLFCAKEYVRLNWVMQIHYNCMRNPNSAMLKELGPDTGFDCIGSDSRSPALFCLMDRLYREQQLPRTVLYSLDGSDNAYLDSLIGAFQGSETAGKLQHGSAWWFNDHKQGMREQLISSANLGLLGNFIGMLTDSRSFLSYTRHEYFRRILCSLIGEWVENGEFPNDEKFLGQLVENICYYNAERYFDLSFGGLS